MTYQMYHVELLRPFMGEKRSAANWKNVKNITLLQIYIIYNLFGYWLDACEIESEKLFMADKKQVLVVWKWLSDFKEMQWSPLKGAKTRHFTHIIKFNYFSIDFFMIKEHIEVTFL